MKRWLASPIIVFILAGMLIVGLFDVIGLWRRLSLLKSTEVALEQKLAHIESENNDLKAQLSVNMSQDSMERDAKSRLNLKKPNEEVVVVVPQTTQVSTTTQAHLEWYQRFWLFIKKLF